MFIIKVFQSGDLVYSYADKQFYVIISVVGDMLFEVYTMESEIKNIIDVTLTHIENIDTKQCENGVIIYYNKNKQ